jgi:hypothetical protein
MHPGRGPGFVFMLGPGFRRCDGRDVISAPFSIKLAVLAAMLVFMLTTITAIASPAPEAGTSGKALPVGLAIPAFKMHYKVLRNGWHIGAADFTLERRDDAWHFHSSAHPTGIASWFVSATFTESSRFTIVDGRIRPLEYRYTDSNSPDHNEHIRFEWQTGKAHDQKGKHKTDVAIEPGMLDRLTAQLAISRQLAAGVPLMQPFLIVHDGEVDPYHLKRTERGKTDTPAGTFKTVLVVRKEPGSKRKNKFWLAPDYAWLPVKMQQIEPGDATYTFTLARLQWLGTRTENKKQ